MPLKITNPATQVGVLNNWADQIETNIRSLTTHSSRHAESIKAIQTSSGSNGVTSVGLVLPRELIVTGSPVTSSGDLTAAWASEPSGSLFQGPVPGLSGYEGSTLQAFRSVSGGGHLIDIQTPISATSFGLYFSNAGVTIPAPSGWTSFGAATQFFWKAITGVSPVVTDIVIPTNVDATAALSLFKGPVPTFIQSGTTSGQSGVLNFSSSNTTGNTLIVAIRSSMGGPAGPFSIVMSDTNNNVYQQLVNQSFLGGNGIQFQSAVYVCANCVGGANSVNWSVSGPGSFNTPVITIAEFSPLGLGNGIPFFGPLSPGLIPPINLASSGNGGVGGILPVVDGGTGQANLTAHGVLLGEGTSAIVATGTGTSGQVLTSRGPSVDPNFQGIVVQTTSTPLGSAQLLALLGTPVTLVPAPGVGFTILPISISILLFGGSAAYTDAGGAVSFTIGSTSQALASNAIFTTATSPNKQIQRVAGFSATDTAGNPPTDENAAMTISKTTNNFAAGNGTAKVIVHYVILPTT